MGWHLKKMKFINEKETRNQNTKKAWMKTIDQVMESESQIALVVSNNLQRTAKEICCVVEDFFVESVEFERISKEKCASFAWQRKD